MSTLTIVHVLISLVGIVSGFVLLNGFLKNRQLNHGTDIFLATTIATNATGFLFPFEKLLPSHILAVISLVVLGVTVVAWYQKHLAGRWRPTFVVTALFAQYVNVFVLVVQLFLKVPALKALAPTQTEAPFAVAQLAVLVGFLVAGYAAVGRFRTGTGTPSQLSAA